MGACRISTQTSKVESLLVVITWHSREALTCRRSLGRDIWINSSCQLKFQEEPNSRSSLTTPLTLGISKSSQCLISPSLSSKPLQLPLNNQHRLLLLDTRLLASFSQLWLPCQATLIISSLLVWCQTTQWVFISSPPSQLLCRAPYLSPQFKQPCHQASLVTWASSVVQHPLEAQEVQCLILEPTLTEDLSPFSVVLQPSLALAWALIPTLTLLMQLIRAPVLRDHQTAASLGIPSSSPSNNNNPNPKRMRNRTRIPDMEGG